MEYAERLWGELMEGETEVVNMLNTYLPYHMKVKKDIEIEELLSKYGSWRYGQRIFIRIF